MHASAIRLWPFLAVLLVLVASPLPADEAGFRLHVLDARATYCACAVFDVDGDGRPDVFSGGRWYAAPDWQAHYVRDVQEIRGRFDDYANLPMDVNGDGWLDVVSANYRSKSLYWVEHPGGEVARETRPWRKHVIDTPGAMETGRLADVDQDGRLDVLPNGVDFAAWWELLPVGESLREGDTDPSRTVQWRRHQLPRDLAGHGIGIGDMNGDGRADLVGPRGWLEAPQDRRQGRWLWHADFELDRDCSIPILVLDVDQDGDSDVVWGRGHRIGLYWLEQDVADGGATTWRRHAIDTSWSQPHSILLADLDDDGQDELVAGKRYMGHDGKDPGEYDPLVAYWYDFDPARRTWQRHVISPGGPAGFGLDPKAADLDGDGDVDIVAAGRSGLYWFENLLLGDQQRGDSELPSPAPPPVYDDHSEPLVYRDENGVSRPVRTPAEMAIRRAHVLAGMQEAMGPLPLPSRRVPLDVEIGEAVACEGYTRRHVTFAAEPGDRVPAYLLIPDGLQRPAPAMLCLHPTSTLAKDELAGIDGRPSRMYAHELAQRGFVCLVPDYPSFGEYTYDFRQEGADFASGSMKAIWNNVRAVDLLETRPEVDRDRIGVIGHSLGGHNALFTAAFDQRLRAVVTSCGFTAFHHYYEGKLAGWTSDRYMPRIRDMYGNDPDKVPFDFYEVLAAIAPRGVFINAPLEDSNFEVTGVRKVVEAVRGVYAVQGAPDSLQVVYPDCGHDFPEDVRASAYEWLGQQLAK